MTIPDVIPLSWKIGAAALLCAVLWGAYGLWHHEVYQSGLDDGKAIGKAEEKKISDAAIEKLAVENKKTVSLQLKLDATIATHKQQDFTKEAEHAKELNSARAAVRAGALKLRIAVSSCAISAAGQNQGASTDPGAGSEARADILPGTADDFVRIAGAAAKDVRDYNALVVQYNEVRAACN